MPANYYSVFYEMERRFSGNHITDGIAFHSITYGKGNGRAQLSPEERWKSFIHIRIQEKHLFLLMPRFTKKPSPIS